MKLRSNKLDAMTFNSIAELKSFPSSRFSDGAVANVLGYYAPGDGGGGEFVLNLSSVAADNGGTVIAPDAGSGRWERVWDQSEISVLCFGARGNAVYSLDFDPSSGNPMVSTVPSGDDDTTAIKNALSAMGAVGGGDVVFPATSGWYLVKAGTLSNGTDENSVPIGVNLVGRGGRIYIDPQRVRFFGDDVSSTPAAGMSGSNGFRLRGKNTVRDLVIDGGSQNNRILTANAEQIYFRVFQPIVVDSETTGIENSRVYFENCLFYNASGSFIASGAQECEECLISNCSFGDFKDHCVYVPAKRTFINGCSLSANKTSTVRDAFKTINAEDSVLEIINVNGTADNAIFCTIDGRGDLSDSMLAKHVLISNCNISASIFVASVWQDTSVGGYEKIIIENSEIKSPSGYGILIGQIGGTAANVDEILIENCTIECALANSFSSGGTNAAGNTATKKINNLIIRNVDVYNTSTTIGTAAFRLYGSYDYLIASGVRLFLPGISAADGLLDYRWYASNEFAPDAGIWRIESCFVEKSNQLISFKEPAANISSMPISIIFNANQFSESVSNVKFVSIANLAGKYAANAWTGKLTITNTNKPGFLEPRSDWPDYASSDIYWNFQNYTKFRKTLSDAEVTALNDVQIPVTESPSPYAKNFGGSYFAGAANQHVDLTSNIALAGDFVLSCKVIFANVTGTRYVLFGSSAEPGNSIYIENSNPKYNRGGSVYTASSITILPNTYYECEITRSGTNVTFEFYGGGETQTETVNSVSVSTLNVNRIGRASLFPIVGTIWDVNINAVAAYDGNINSSDGWLDTIGANDGTLSGSPASVSSVISFDSGFCVVIEDILFELDYASQFTGSNNMEFRYDGAAGDKVINDVPFSVLNTDGDAVYVPSKLSTPIVPSLGSPVFAFVPVANPGGGTGSSVKITTVYKTLSR